MKLNINIMSQTYVWICFISIMNVIWATCKCLYYSYAVKKFGRTYKKLNNTIYVKIICFFFVYTKKKTTEL